MTNKIRIEDQTKTGVEIEEEINESEEIAITDSKLTPDEQIAFLERKLEQAELEATDKNIAFLRHNAGLARYL